MSKKTDLLFDAQKAYSVLALSTFTFFVCYMVWMLFAVIGVPIAKILDLNASQFGLMTAIPVLTGSLLRAPFGFWVDRFSSRSVMFIVLLVSVLPIWLISLASSYWQFLVLGAFMGLIGCSYTIGISHVVHWFPERKQGLAMGIYGAGCSGATLNKIFAPLLIAIFGWTMVPQIYAYLILAVALLFFLLDHRNSPHVVNKETTLKKQLSVLREARVLRYCQYYSIAFGAFVALSFWMVKYYVNEFNLDLQEAALLAACFTFPGSVFRVLGGWFSDKYGGHNVILWVMRISFVCLVFLSFPNIDITFASHTYSVGLHLYAFVICMFIFGMALSIGAASVLKCVSDGYLSNMGIVAGVVGTAGGVSGSVWLIIFGILLDLTGVYSSAFVFLLFMVFGALILIHLDVKK